MAQESTHALEEELARLEPELVAARELEHSTEDRHDREGLPETEAVLEVRSTRVERLEERRGELLGELGRRAITEKAGRPTKSEAPRAPDRTGRPCDPRGAGGPGACA